MTVLKRSTDTQTGISVVRRGDCVETFNILDEKIHVVDASRVRDGIMIHRWFSSVSDDEIKEILGGHFLEEFIAHACTLLLADLSQWVVSWDGVNDWLRDDMMPRMYAAGLLHLAVVVAPTEASDSNRFAAERFSTDNPGVNSSFLSEESAATWLKKQR